MAEGKHQDALKLIAALKAGNSAARERLLALAEGAIWPVAVALAGEGTAGEEAYLAVISALEANGFARMGRYAGGKLSSFLRLVAQDVLGARAASSFSLNPNRAWRDFSRLFQKSIEKRICEKFPRDSAQWEDIYQEISFALTEDDYRRIRAYRGKESFVGFIGTVVRNLLADLVREETGRWRLPAAISRLPRWQQLVFEYAAWKGLGMDADRIAEALKGKIDPVPSRAEIEAALDKLAAAIHKARADQGRGQVISGDTPDGKKTIESVASPLPNPLEALLQKEEERQQAEWEQYREREKQRLPPREQMYLSLIWRATEPMPPRKIAQAMVLPVDEVYPLKDRMKNWEEKIKRDFEKTEARPSDQGRSVN